MSDRVRNDDTQRRLEQQRMTQAKTKAQTEVAREKFAKKLGQQKVETGQAGKQDRGSKSKTLKGQKTSESLLSHQGSQAAAKFHSMLESSGKESVDRNQAQTKARSDDMKESELSTRDTQSKENAQETKKNAERADAVNDERRQGGGGSGMGGSLGGDAGSGAHQGTGQGAPTASLGAAANAPAPETAQAHGAQAPQLPPAIVQELVKRVMVGVDAKGIGTFVIQLKDDVLGGATVQISSDNGKIGMKVTTNDKDVARLLKASEGPLARAFASKGMTLDRLEVEAR